MRIPLNNENHHHGNIIYGDRKPSTENCHVPHTKDHYKNLKKIFELHSRYKYEDGPFLELMHDLDAFLLNIVKDADGDFVPIMRLRSGSVSVSHICYPNNDVEMYWQKHANAGVDCPWRSGDPNNIFSFFYKEDFINNQQKRRLTNSPSLYDL